MKIPKLVVGAAFKMIKKSVEKKAGFDINKLKPIKSAPNCFIPALFAHANGDDFIAVSHSKEIKAVYAGDKNLITFEGDHQSARPKFFYDSVSIFISNNLLVDADFKDDNPFVEEKDEPAPYSTAVSFGRGVDDELELAIQLSLVEADSKKPAQQPAKPSPAPAKPNSADIPNDEDEQLKLALALSMMDVKPTETDKKADSDKKPEIDTDKKSKNEEGKSKDDSKAKADKKDKKSKDSKKSKREKGDKDEALIDLASSDDDNTKPTKSEKKKK